MSIRFNFSGAKGTADHVVLFPFLTQTKTERELKIVLIATGSLSYLIDVVATGTVHHKFRLPFAFVCFHDFLKPAEKCLSGSGLQDG